MQGTPDQTIQFYNLHADQILQESIHDQNSGARETFSSLLPPRGTLFDAGCGPGLDLKWFKNAGFGVEGADGSTRMVELAQSAGVPVQVRDLRLLNLKKEHYDGIWCHRTIAHFSIEDCHRILGLFFQALKPTHGLMFISYLEGAGPIAEPVSTISPVRTFYQYPQPALYSLLRQSGFHVLLRGERTEGDHNWIGVVAKRA